MKPRSTKKKVFAVSFYAARISNKEAKAGKLKKCQLCGDCICIRNLIWVSQEFGNETRNSFHFAHFNLTIESSWGMDSFWMKCHQRWSPAVTGSLSLRMVQSYSRVTTMHKEWLNMCSVDFRPWAMSLLL